MKLTPIEADLVAWAIDPMRDMWCTEEGAFGRGEETVYAEAALPTLTPDYRGLDGKTPAELQLSAVAEINDDLEYRITVQLWDMAGEWGGIYADGRADAEAMDGVRTKKAIRQLARKLGWEI